MSATLGALANGAATLEAKEYTAIVNVITYPYVKRYIEYCNWMFKFDLDERFITGFDQDDDHMLVMMDVNTIGYGGIFYLDRLNEFHLKLDGFIRDYFDRIYAFMQTTFAKKDGDHALMCRVLGFYQPFVHNAMSATPSYFHAVIRLIAYPHSMRRIRLNDIDIEFIEHEGVIRGERRWGSKDFDYFTMFLGNGLEVSGYAYSPYYMVQCKMKNTEHFAEPVRKYINEYLSQIYAFLKHKFAQDDGNHAMMRLVLAYL